MKCWRCGKEINDNVSECIYCHARQVRSVPVTQEGAALRQLYDHYGPEMALRNPVLLANGFGDVVTDSLSVDVKKVKNNLKVAMDVGIGQRYMEQLSIGRPDPAFDARIKKIMTEDADMSEKAADRLIGWFDEMIGWRDSAQNTAIQQKEQKEADYQTACSKIDSRDPAALHEALRMLQGLSGYKDADRLARQCEERIDQQKKEEIYQRAKRHMDGLGGESGYGKAMDLFGQIPGYRDSDILRRQCLDKIYEYQAEEQKPKISKGLIIGVLAGILLLIIILASRNHGVQKVPPAVAPTATSLPAATNAPTMTPKPTSTPAEPKVGDVITFGRYEQDEFSGADPIEWQVLTVENGRALLLSKYALEAKGIHNTRTDINWEKCDLRTWLNGTFYNTAFNTAEKAKIQEVLIKNPEQYRYLLQSLEGTGIDTRDKIFLLNIDEVQKYLPTNEARICAMTIHAYEGAFVGKIKDYEVFNWWLRTPGSEDSHHCMSVGQDGELGSIGSPVEISEGVRPALWLDLN